MSHSPMQDLPDELIARARRVRLVCFDVDGTLTDGRLYYDHAGNESKAYSVLDGLGMKLLERCGIRVALITARASLSAQQRGQDLGLRVQIGVGNKREAVQALCQEWDIAIEDVAFMGDDLHDLRAMRAVGFPVCPANAHPWTAPHALWQTRARGGEGAARELCDLLLTVQGHADAIIGEFMA